MQRAWFIPARSLKTKPFLNVPPNLSCQDGSVSLLTACFIGPVVNLVWRGILNAARAPSKLNSTLPKSWNRKCNWWPPLAGDLTCGPGFQTIGIWLQSAFSGWEEKGNQWGVRSFSEGRTFSEASQKTVHEARVYDTTVYWAQWKRESRRLKAAATWRTHLMPFRNPRA